MKVQQIKQPVAACDLNDWGTAGISGERQVQVSGIQYVVPGRDAVDVGVFECTPGRYRRSVKQAEVMHFLLGEGSFTPDGEGTIDFRDGDTLLFEEGTEGLWEIRETMRKIYVIF